tara:strand:+ start:2743 stop:2922 length:180 start_codon:yes stop_codon:yes gene_type:complete
MNDNLYEVQQAWKKIYDTYIPIDESIYFEFEVINNYFTNLKELVSFVDNPKDPKQLELF